MDKEKPAQTFIVDCHYCKTKVAALTKADVPKLEEDGDEFRIFIGACPKCDSLLVGRTEVVLDYIEKGGDDFDIVKGWSDVVRVFPKPPKSLLSRRVPRVVKSSLAEAEKCIQVNANTAGCVMLGRALEAMCMDMLKEDAKGKPKPIRLVEAIKELGKKEIIDKRLIEWSDELRGFRNTAAHAVDVHISREDVEDLQNFVYAILEYVYDLADRYNQFKVRQAKRSRQKD